MSALSPAPAIRREPPWWVVLLAIPLLMTSALFAAFAAFGGVSWIDAVTASRQETHSVALAASGSIAVNATSAVVSIEAGPDGQVSVEDWMQVRSATRALARTALATFALSNLSSTEAGATVNIPAPEDFNLTAFQLQRRVTIRVPATAALTLRGRSVSADLHDLRGSLDIGIGSGAIRLLRVAVTGSDRIVASSGAIDFEGELQGGSLDIETDSGAIRVQVPRGTNATYDVATSSGAIYVRPETGQAIATAGTDRTTTGVLGSGGGTAIKLRATSGALTIQVG